MAQSELSSWAFTGAFLSVFMICGSIPSPPPSLLSTHTPSPRMWQISDCASNSAE